MACARCQKRRLRCDGDRPTCSNCAQLNRGCEYAEVSDRRGPRRNVSGFEEHLVAYERQTDGALKNPNSAEFLADVNVFAQYNRQKYGQDMTHVDTASEESDKSETLIDSSTDSILHLEDGSNPNLEEVDTVEVIGLGAHGPWLSESIKKELTELFFCDVYPGIPIIHKSRYYASLHLDPDLQPPFCLSYAMWALAAIQNSKWSHLANHCYEKARTYLEQDEFRAAGTEILNVAHVQCWTLIATYESYMLLSLRTWSSIRRAAALANVLRLHTLDESDDPASQLLPETQDPSELEERRRAFWSAFSSDRWISSRTGYPMTITENNITTKLPSSEHSFNSGLVEETQSLQEALEMGFDPNASLYGARAVLTCILGRIMRHIGSATSFGRTTYSSQQFWTQHTKLDSLLTRVSSSRSAKLRPSSSTTDPGMWSLDMWLHGLIICLHRTAVDCATKQSNHDQVTHSLERCRAAADHIIHLLRSIAHIETKKMDPYTASCVYMAATVLIRGHECGDSRSTDIEDLKYLQQVLQLMHKHWKVTEIFITQFQEDLAKSGINVLMTSKNDKETPSRKRVGRFKSVHRRSPSETVSGVVPV